MGAEQREKLDCGHSGKIHIAMWGQELAALSTAPVWSNGAPEPRPLVLRAYITAAGDSFGGHAGRPDPYFDGRN